MAPVRSRRFFGPTLLAAAGVWQSVYTVPADRTAVLRSLYVMNYAASVTFVGLGIHSLGVGGARTWGMEIPAFTTEELEDLVGNPGDQLWFQANAGNTAYVSGFGSLLLGAPE